MTQLFPLHSSDDVRISDKSTSMRQKSLIIGLSPHAQIVMYDHDPQPSVSYYFSYLMPDGKRINAISLDSLRHSDQGIFSKQVGSDGYHQAYPLDINLQMYGGHIPFKALTELAQKLGNELKDKDYADIFSKHFVPDAPVKKRPQQRQRKDAAASHAPA